MAPTLAQYEEMLENIEQVISTRNIEDYLTEFPESDFPLPPDPTYDELKVPAYEHFLSCISSAVKSEVLTTGSDGRATITFPTTSGAVVTASVVDATADNVFYQVVIESVTSTQAVVRVTQNTAVTVLGIAVLSVPSAANAASVHVVVNAPG